RRDDEAMVRQDELHAQIESAGRKGGVVAAFGLERDAVAELAARRCDQAPQATTTCRAASARPSRSVTVMASAPGARATTSAISSAAPRASAACPMPVATW